jgi:hypothetical protein
MRPYLKKPSQKIGLGGVAQSEGLEFKPQYCKKKKVFCSGDSSSLKNLSVLQQGDWTLST